MLVDVSDNFIVRILWEKKKRVNMNLFRVINLKLP